MSNKARPLKVLNSINLHLGISACIVIVVGLIYGVYPSKIMPVVFDFKVESLELKNMLRAIMGLYLGLGIFWVMGIIKPTHWRTATLTNVIFMGGLAFGRTISSTFDGISEQFTIALILEIILMIWGILNLKSNKGNESID